MRRARRVLFLTLCLTVGYVLLAGNTGCSAPTPEPTRTWVSPSNGVFYWNCGPVSGSGTAWRIGNAPNAWMVTSFKGNLGKTYAAALHLELRPYEMGYAAGITPAQPSTTLNRATMENGDYMIKVRVASNFNDPGVSCALRMAG